MFSKPVQEICQQFRGRSKLLKSPASKFIPAAKWAFLNAEDVTVFLEISV
jgi:hypothetical protein